MRVDRNTVLWFALVGAILAGVVWRASDWERLSGGAEAAQGRLGFSAHAPAGPIRAGSSPLGLGKERDGFLFVPRANAPANPMPLLILLHGATQRAGLFEPLIPLADSLGVVLLAPDSRDMTWDAIQSDFGVDIAFLDKAIMHAFDNGFIDPCRVVVGGFSDGASYALSLGIRNAERLRGVVALSPGFVIPASVVGKVPVFIRHGTNDRILPIDRTSRPLVQALREGGFELDYEEFDGPHMVRPGDSRSAMQWVVRRSCVSPTNER
jgi:phospholipase/carboxylesterase